MTPYEEAMRRIAEAESTGAEILDLGDLLLDALPPALSRLTRLRVLALGCGGAVLLTLDELGSGFEEHLPSFRDLEPLRGLSRLTSLDLSFCEGLTTLEPLRGLAGLTSLDLTSCERLTTLDPLRGLAGLTSLNLSFCKSLTTLEPLRGLRALKSLNLSECGPLGPFDPIRALFPSLAELRQAGSIFNGLMPEVYGTNKDENVLSMVRRHFDDLSRGASAFAEVKAFVLGNGSAGKSHLCNRLLGGDYPAAPSSIPSTHGVQVKEFALPVPGLEEPARVNVWDFGGQDIYHGSHALFVQRRAVFLLLWTPDTERGEFRQSGVTMRHRPLSYWLDYIRHTSGTDAPVLVIQSKCDGRTDRRDLPVDLPEDFAFIEALEVSAKTGRDLNRLRERLAEAAQTLFPNGWPTVGVGRVEMRVQVRDLARTRRTISVEEFRALCRKNGKISDSDALLSFFHECGVLFHKAGLFGGLVILDQNWALEAIYTLLDRGKSLPTLVALGGRFTRADLQALVWQGKPDADCDALIGMMVSCGICFRAGERHLPGGVKQAVYVAPELLPPWSAALVPMFHRLRRDKAYLGFVVRYPFLHDGVLRSFLSGIGWFAGDRAVYWKYGCYFHEAETACDVFISSAWDKETGPQARGRIAVQAWGRDRVAVLRTLHGFLREHRLAVEPETRFHGFDEFDGREPERPRELVASAPAPATVCRQVFLSYAWGDKHPTDMGQLREAVAQRTIERLTKQKFDVTYDRQDMKPGDLISAFIARIGDARRIVVILSRKYLESAYCVKELGSVFNRSNRDKSDFLSRVHPIVLPDADLHAVERYAEYWMDYPKRRPAQYAHGGEGAVRSPADIAHWLIDLPALLGYLGDPIHAGDPEKQIDRVLEMLEHR